MCHAWLDHGRQQIPEFAVAQYAAWSYLESIPTVPRAFLNVQGRQAAWFFGQRFAAIVGTARYFLCLQSLVL